MTGALSSAISGMASAREIRESLALAYWSRVVGPAAARASEAIRVQNGILFVRTKSSAWSHEISLHKTEILQGLNRLLQAHVIEDVKFRTDGTRWISKEIEEEATGPVDLAAVELDDFEHEKLRNAVEAIERLEDAHVRRALIKRVTDEARLRHWRLENGWRVCIECDAAHKTEGPVCPLCRLAMEGESR